MAAPDTAGIDAGPPRAQLTAGGLLGWLLRSQRRSVLVGAVAGIVWMAAPAAVPAVLGFLVDEGIVAGSGGALAAGLIALLALGAVGALAGAVRHRQACLLHERTQLAVTTLVADRALDPRGGLDGRLSPGEVLSRATSDARQLGGPADLTCRGTAAVVVFAGVAVALLAISVELGLLILLGLPVALALMLPLWRPLDRRSAEAQRALGEAATIAEDAVAGLGVLRGLGAEAQLVARHRARVHEVRASALSLARIDAGWEALLVAVPGALVAAVAWVGGRLALEGRLSAGELVACFAYVIVLVEPIATFGEVGRAWARGLASARRVTAVLAVPTAVSDAPVRGAANRPARGAANRPGRDAAHRPGRPEPGVPVAVRLAGVHAG